MIQTNQEVLISAMEIIRNIGADFIAGNYTGKIQLNFQDGKVMNVNKEIKETIQVKEPETKQ